MSEGEKIRLNGVRNEIWNKGTYSGDGITLLSTTHPKASLMRRIWRTLFYRGVRKGSMETVEIDTIHITKGGKIKWSVVNDKDSWVTDDPRG